MEIRHEVRLPSATMVFIGNIETSKEAHCFVDLIQAYLHVIDTSDAK